ncbi:MAG: hypothetical protein CXZ00_14265 [Acidobacteria bacterium]|mgnify:CR=1 FL=1|nr:MAG: hypothetical protein CXZ00_14265 [Acidobacteriota bacterium]
MTAMLILTVISVGAVAFLVRFFVALCKESRGHTYQLVRITPEPVKQDVEVGHHQLRFNIPLHASANRPRRNPAVVARTQRVA